MLHGNEPIMGMYLAQSCGVAYVVYGREEVLGGYLGGSS